MRGTQNLRPQYKRCVGAGEVRRRVSVCPSYADHEVHQFPTPVGSGVSLEINVALHGPNGQMCRATHSPPHPNGARGRSIRLLTTFASMTKKVEVLMVF